MLLALKGVCAEPSAGGAPWSFTFRHALPRWKDGLPVGNGTLGAQVWGTDSNLYLTLDRGDVWDLRYQRNTRKDFAYAHLQALLREGRHDLTQSQMSSDVGPTANIRPTRPSIGRMKISLPAGSKVEWASLDMQHGEARWMLNVGGKPVEYRVLACVGPDVILVTLDGVTGSKPAVRFLAIGSADPAVATSTAVTSVLVAPTLSPRGKQTLAACSVVAAAMHTCAYGIEEG